MNSVRKLMFGAVATTMLVSCSNEMDDPADYTQGSPAKVTAEVNALRSRVANFNTWETNDEIGLSTEIDANIPYTTTEGNGTFTPSGTDILYIKGSSSVKVAGYYPYSNSVNGRILAFDVINDENADYLYASASATRENPEVKLNFTHVMSRLVFNFNLEIDSYVLKGLVTTGELDILNGTVTNAETTNDIPGATTQTVTSFIPPQKASAAKLCFVKDGISYVANLPEKDFLSGNQYTYTVTLNETGVEVTLPESNTISGFENNDMGDLEYTEQEPEMAVGDWYLSDGTTVSHSKALTAEQKEQVIGIVVYAGNPSTTTLATLFNEKEGAWNNKCNPSNVTVDYMATNYPTCTNGIVMAIGGREKSAFIAENTTTTITEWWSSQESLKATTMAPCADDIKDAETNTTKVAASNRYYCLGLQNTYILKQYVAAGNAVAAITNLNNYSATNAAPEGTTGWYIPSLMEIVQFLYGGVTEGVKPVINNSLIAAGADALTNEQYWSSSEGSFKAIDGANVNQWYFGRVKKATVEGVADYTADLSKGNASSEYRNIYFLAF